MNLLDKIKEEIIVLISNSKKRRVRPLELKKTVSSKLRLPGSLVKEALDDLVKSRELVFTYRDPCSYVEIPNGTKHVAARPMKVVEDATGDTWICDADVDPSRDLAKQGCWRCGSLAFTRND
ncbi:hypothetical protein ACFLU6_02135 [Acidobacteriota bacterium]